MPKNGHNGNGLARRVERLESGYNLLNKLLSEKSAKLLFSSHTPELNRLLNQHAEGTISAKSMEQLCQWLRRLEGDREQSRDIRLASSLLLIGIELTHSVRTPRRGGV